MIKRLNKLTGYQKQRLSEEAKVVLDEYEESGNPEIVWNGHYHECLLHNDDDEYLVLYKCQCGTLIADYDDYSGRDEEVDTCPKCEEDYE